MDIAVTGANGGVGMALIKSLAERPPFSDIKVRALVRRSGYTRSFQSPSAKVLEIDYCRPESLRMSLEGANAVVHLAGSLMPRKGETLFHANVETTRIIANVAADSRVETFIYLSFPDADSSSENEYLRSKGIAEELIRKKNFSGAILRVPMILGPKSKSIATLCRMAAAPLIPVIGGGSTRMQPIAQADVIGAIVWALFSPARPMHILNLVGPETLTYAELLRRIGRKLGREPRIMPLPKRAVWASALVLGKFLPSLGWNTSLFDTIFNEHLVQPSQSIEIAPIKLTPIDLAIDQALGLPEL